MAERDSPEIARRPAGQARSAWVELAGGAIMATILIGFLAVAFTSMHW